MPASATAISSIDSAADGHAQQAGRAGRDAAAQQARRDAVPRIGTGRVCGTAAGIAPRLIHSRTPSRCASSTIVRGQRVPAVVGLGAGQDEDVAAPEPRGRGA